MKKKVVIITNIPSPYRVDFFYYLQEHVTKYDFHFIYSSPFNKTRKWHVDEDKIQNSVYLKSKRIKIKKRYDELDYIIPYGVGKALDQLKPDVVVAMEYNPTVLLAMHWCRKNKVKYISWTDGTLYAERNLKKPHMWARKYIINRADAFIGSSTASKETQIAYGALADKCFISYLTVDIDKYLTVKHSYGSGKLVYVGSLIQRKGLDLLLTALAQTPPDIRLVIVGCGREKEELEKQAQELGIHDRIEYRGFLEGEALRNCYEECDAFVLPTREDCYGLVILEAMCASLPVISSKYADGAADLITPQVNGFIVDPQDSAGFAVIIQKTLEDPDRLAKMGAASYRKAQEFSFEHVAKGYVDAIDYVLK
jgi:glycosyltransferase involved in cell wall biosynthesis